MEPNTKAIHSNFWANIFSSSEGRDNLNKSLKSIPIFKELSNKDLNLLKKIVHSRNFVTGEYIFYQGDPGIGLYIILEGEVIVQRTFNSDVIVSMAQFSKGDFLGELALIDGEKRSASAIAKTDAKLAVIFKPDLDEFIATYPRKGILILNGIAQTIAARLRQINEDHLALLQKTNIISESNYGT